MAQRITRKQLLKQDEIAEAAFDFGQWLEQHVAQIAKWAGAVLLVVAAILAGILLVNNRKQALANSLADAQARFAQSQAADAGGEQDLTAVLDGFDAVIAKSPKSEAGQVALYFRAVTLRKMGRLDEAVAAAEQLADRDSKPETLALSAELLLVDLYASSGRAQDAITRLSANLESTSPIVPTDQALLKIGRIHKEQGNLESARQAWQRVVDEFPGSLAAGEARQLLETGA